MMSSECALVIGLDEILEAKKGLDWVNWPLENQYKTITFLVLLLKQWKRTKSMYIPNIRRLENEFSTHSLIDFW